MVRRLIRLLAVPLLASPLACAGTSVVKLDDTLQPGTEDVGLPIFVPEQWRQLLVVTQSGGKASATWMKVPVYPARPNYAIKEKRGWGSSEFAAHLSGGIVTSLNAETDSRATETVAALGTVVAAVGSALSGGGAFIGAASAAGVASLATPDSANQPFTAVQNQVTVLRDDIKADLNDAQGAEAAGLRAVLARLDEADQRFSRDTRKTLVVLPDIQRSLKAARAAAVLRCPDGGSGNRLCTYKIRVAAIMTKLNTAAADVLGLASQPAIQIFEFTPDPAQPLRRIYP